jgi:FAD:protein FMN transferase
MNNNIMKRNVLLVLVTVLLIWSGCTGNGGKQYNRYSASILDSFDTLVRVVAYTEDEEQFDAYFSFIHQRLQELHRLYDIYNDYEGINNLKTVNDQAGINPVAVDEDIIDLLLFSKQWSQRTGGSVNIAMGPVLAIWHRYREDAYYDPEKATLPPLDLLHEAAGASDLERVIIDLEQKTVFLPDRGMSIDVGAVAKGFALELVAREVEQKGLRSAIISAGGNIRTIGLPLTEDREHWGVGVQDPRASIFGGSEKLLDVIYITEGSVDTSGDYQRYYVVDGEVIHHLIDPQTLMPAVYYRAVTVVAKDSGVADFMSTALFLLDYKESLALAESIIGLEALWVMPDGEIRTTAGMDQMLRSYQ